MAEKCDICGHETSVLDHGTGKYAEKMVCGLCEDRNFREQLLRVENNKLKDDRAALVLVAGKCVALIDAQVQKGECNKTYSLIRNELNHELVKLGLGI